MSDLDRAKALLAEGDYTCVLCCGEHTYTSRERGVAPLLEYLANDIDLRGFSAADKVVGKAAALLFALAGVREVYAPVMSQGGLRTLALHGILPTCDHVASAIRNRTDTGICPMEQAVADIESPREALEAILAARRALQHPKSAV